MAKSVSNKRAQASRLILEKLEEIQLQLLTLKNDSPRKSKDVAAKYLKIGRPKLEHLVETGKVPHYIDAWGEEYFLRKDLDFYLESNKIKRS